MADSKKYLDSNGLLYFWQKIKAQLGAKVDKVDGKGLSTNDYTTDEKNKLTGIATGANKTVVDNNITETGTNPVQGKAVYSALATKSNTDHTHSVATQSANGFLSSADKTKLDGISAGANKITVDTAISATSTNPVQNKIISSALASKSDTGHTHDIATTTANGFMSSTDKTKLDGIADNANNYELPTATKSTLGGVIVGSNINVATDGTISVSTGDTKTAGVVTLQDSINTSTSTAATPNAVNTAVNKKADKATSLSGYGITDAFTKTEVTESLKKKADTATTLAGYGISDAYTKDDVYTKDEIDGKLTSAMHYKGEVDKYSDLPTTDQEAGDMWNVKAEDTDHGINAGDNVVWNGDTKSWDVMDGWLDLSIYMKSADAMANSDIDSILAK